MEKLGIELPLLISQIINFIILVFVLTKILYKPILKILDERKRKIEDGLEYAQKAKEEEENLQTARQDVIKRAHEEARKIIEEAKKDALKVREEILKDGKNEVTLLKEKSNKEIKAHEQELYQQVVAYTVDIATNMVKRLLPDLLKDEDQHKIIREQLQLLEKRHEQTR